MERWLPPQTNLVENFNYAKDLLPARVAIWLLYCLQTIHVNSDVAFNGASTTPGGYGANSNSNIWYIFFYQVSVKNVEAKSLLAAVPISWQNKKNYIK